MGLNIGIDFDKNDWVAAYSSPTDAPNLLGANSVRVSSLLRQVSGTGGSAAAGSDFYRYTNERLLYGKNTISWITGTSASAFINIGYNGASFDAVSQVAGTYSVSVFAKLLSGSSANTFRAVLSNGGSALSSGTAAALNSTTWTKLTVSGSNPSTQNLCVRVAKASGTSSLSVEIAGVMLVSGSSIPSYFNCGAASLLEPVTSYAMDAGWELGFKAPYQYVPPVGRATINLNNDSKRFSPEFSSSPLYPNLVPGLLIQIADPTYGIKWTGWTETWKPTPGATGPRDCTLTATDARLLLEQPLPLLTLKTDQAGWQSVRDCLLLSIISAPNSTEGIPTLSPGNAETVNWDTYPSETVPYHGDGDSEADPAAKIIADITGANQCKFWFNRQGQYNFTSSQGDDTPASYVNIAADWMTAVYSDAPIINECNVSIFRRKASAAAVTLWELDETINIAAGLSESFRAYFRNTTTDKILVGALSSGMSITHTANAGSTTSALSAISAQSALVTFNNAAAAGRNILTASITGTRIVALREIYKQHTDTTSEGLYGTKGESLRFNWVQNRTWAAKLAKYRVERFKNPRKVMTQIKLNAGDMPSEVHQLNIGRAVYVSDDQTAHAGYYAVIGESHSAKTGLSDHTVTIYLEPLYPTTVEATSV